MGRVKSIKNKKFKKTGLCHLSKKAGHYNKECMKFKV